MQMRSTLQALVFLTIASYINNAAAADELTNPTFRVSSPPPCVEQEGNQGFCIIDTEYNNTIEDLFRTILEKNPSLANISRFLDEANNVKENETLPNARQNPNERTVCPATSEVIHPRRGRTINNEWVYILNQRSAKQGFKIEKCLKPDIQCTAGGFRLKQSTCRQKFVYREALTMSRNGEAIHIETIYMPSCCVCFVPLRK